MPDHIYIYKLQESLIFIIKYILTVNYMLEKEIKCFNQNSLSKSPSYTNNRIAILLSKPLSCLQILC